MEIYQILIILGMLFLIIEIFLTGFFAGSVAIGFFASAIGAYLGLSTNWQILIFSVGTLVAFFTIRPVVNKYGYKTSKHVKTNMESLPGRKAKVVEAISTEEETGRVAIDGDVWKARTEDGSDIPVNTTVEVVRTESIVLIVKPLK
ncbi:MAG: NfeD family protein [Bacteroidales bacterium]|nr:NfeD family protein [Bacteroidales bacterium]